MTAGRLVAAAGLAAVLAGCGGDGSGGAASDAVAPPPVLAAAALPTYPATHTRLTLEEFGRTTPLRGMPERLEELGFRAAAEREFRGTGRGVQRVVARAAELGSPAAARAYVRLIARRAGEYMGGTPEVRPLRAAGGGYLVRPPLCGCHGEVPRLIALSATGARVRVLEVSGARVRPALARRLAALAP